MKELKNILLAHISGKDMNGDIILPGVHLPIEDPDKLQMLEEEISETEKRVSLVSFWCGSFLLTLHLLSCSAPVHTVLIFMSL